MNGHMSDESSFIEDEDGFMTARCACTWTMGPLPGPEEVADALMDHAYEEGCLYGQQVQAGDISPGDNPSPGGES